jgi:MoxR-like ATPase
VQRVALPVLRHRIIPSYAAEAAGVGSDEIVRQLLAFLPATDDLAL